MAQYSVPVANPIAASGWAEGAGDGDGDSFDELDEGIDSGSPDDATTYWLTTDEGVNGIRHDGGAVTDPTSSIDHHCRVRAAKNTSGGRQLDLEIRMLDSVSADVFRDQSNVNISNTWTTYLHSLSGAEADKIDNYDAPDTLVKILETGGGTPRVGWYSTTEFECPDAGGVSLPVFQRPLRVFHGRF